MARPNYTARRREALLVFRNADGMLEIGNGRIRIAPGTVPYFRRVVAALGYVLDAAGGAEAFAQGDALGHAVTIVQPEIPTVPPNAWALPDDIRAATAAGVPVGQTDPSGGVLTGTGAGCASKIFYDPDDWPQRGNPSSPSKHAVLLQLLQQANVYAAGTDSPRPQPANAGAPTAQLRLSCRPAKVGSVLSFPYVVENHGPGDVYVMDSLACVDPATRASSTGDRIAVLVGSDGDAIVGRFIPPMPADRRMAAPVIPLARRLAAGATIEHRLEIPAPYVEASPWLPDVSPQDQRATDIKGIVLAVGYWPAGMNGPAATESVDAPGLYAIIAPSDGFRVVQRFPTNGLQFLRRNDSLRQSSG